MSKYRKINRAKRFARSCRNHGTCDWCKGNRLAQVHREEEKMLQQIKETEELLPNPGEKGYCVSYDAFYNINTREWEGNLCGDDRCTLCAARPLKHSDFCECYLKGEDF